jgi:uncharacterized phage protein (TIGR02218 family)
MNNWLDTDLTCLAFCWQLDRKDGVTLGFTSHDRDLLIKGLLFRAAPGMIPSAIERSVSLDPDSVDLTGILTSDSITAADLTAGRWDGARLTLTAINWCDVANPAIPLVRGTFGTVAVAGDAFQVELRGSTSLLEAAVIERTAPDCRAELGDARCRVDMAGRTRMAVASAAVDANVTLSTPTALSENAYGRLRWLSGDNAGLWATVLANTATMLSLAEVPVFPVVDGDRLELTEGCDRRFATCRDRFANALNFQAEPHLPGNDLITRYVS